MHSRGVHGGFGANGCAALVVALAACGRMTDPASVADRFVDRYYVESNQQGALELSGGVATLRLREELSLTRSARAQPGEEARQVRVYYKRDRLDGEGDARTAEYQLDIRPRGGPGFARRAHLELAREPAGTWRVVRFSETQPK